jgi:hypothetical protein
MAEKENMASYDIVSVSEFLSLSGKEQDEQIIMKIKNEKLKEARKKQSNKRKSNDDSPKNLNGATSEATIIAKIQRTTDYFKSKNDPNSKIKIFSDKDIKRMIFLYPSIINKDPQSIDLKIKLLMSYDEIDKKTAYDMIKKCPSITGYDANRTKEQLDLLQKEGLIDYVKAKPSGFMLSSSLMYALIEYAKERHQTDDLSSVTRSNIFMAGSTLMRIGKCTFKELKKRFPYKVSSENEEDIPYAITGEDLGKATYKDIDLQEINKASKIIQQLINEKERS